MTFLFEVLAAVAGLVLYFNMKKVGKKQEASVAIIVFVVALLVGVFNLFTLNPAGTVGVVDFLGKVSDNTIIPGVNLLKPNANLIK